MTEAITTACVACIGLLAIIVVLIERQLSRRIRALQEEVAGLNSAVSKAHGRIGNLNRFAESHTKALDAVLDHMVVRRER